MSNQLKELEPLTENKRDLELAISLNPDFEIGSSSLPERATATNNIFRQILFLLLLVIGGIGAALLSAIAPSSLTEASTTLVDPQD